MLDLNGKDSLAIFLSPLAIPQLYQLQSRRTRGAKGAISNLPPNSEFPFTDLGHSTSRTRTWTNEQRGSYVD